MALGAPSRLMLYLRPKLAKLLRKKGQNAKTRTREDKINRVERKEKALPETLQGIKPTEYVEKTTFNEQRESPFFAKLPLEIRKMIYAYVWPGAYDHMYHEPRGRHLHFKDGHWIRARCVMYEEDEEDTDFIQARMDQISYSGQGDLLLWQRRLASTWGHRHWRCEERVLYGKPTSIDRADLGALMVVCKKINPEVMESFVECHKLMFNDLYSAYRFLVQQDTSYLIRRIRDLDLTLIVPFHELMPFVAIGGPDTGGRADKGARAECMRPLAKIRNSHLGAILDALADGITCLHSLRVSLDVYDRGPWRKVPETALAPYLEQLRVRKSKTGELNYTVELPAALPIRTHYAGMQTLEDDDDHADDRADGRKGSAAARAFRVVRRPPLRYWQFNPGEVDHFTWETRSGQKERRHCWIALSKATRFFSNPYLTDSTAR